MNVLTASGYVIVSCAYAVYRCRQLWIRGEKRDVWVYGLFMAVSIAVGALLSAGVNLPSFIQPYKMAFESIGKRLLAP